jgi:toluene monooxygenase system protein E
VERWTPLASRAVQALAAVMAEAPVPSDPSPVATRIAGEASREMAGVLTPLS